MKMIPDRHATLTLLALLTVVLGGRPVRAADFTVGSTVDAVDAVPGDGVCATAAGSCTLRAAIREANALPGAYKIILPPGIYQLTIPGTGEQAAATGDLDITGPLTITGADAQTTIIQACALPPPHSSCVDRVFDILSGAAVSLTGVTVRWGSVAELGGGIRIFGSNVTALTLTDVVVTENRATGGGGIIANSSQHTVNLISSTVSHNQTTALANGAGMLLGGPTTITNSSIIGNDGSLSTAGGGFSKTGAGLLTIVNSTIAGNIARTDGGGIWLDIPPEAPSPAATITNSTISGNSAGQNGGGIFVLGGRAAVELNNVTIVENIADGNGNGDGNGGGIARIVAGANPVILRNSILAGNFDRSANATPTIHQECSFPSSAPLTSKGYNLFGNDRFGANDGCNIGGDPALLATDLIAIAPRVAPLAANGGPTLTRALCSGFGVPDQSCNGASPAIDGGNPAGCTDEEGSLLTADQREFAPRAVNGRCDIGAFESGATSPTALPFLITNRGGFSKSSSGQSQTPVVGYARIQPQSGKTTPAGVAIFGLRQNGVLVTEAGVPASPLLRGGRIYAQMDAVVSTGIAVANPNDQAADISYFFTGSDGVDFGAGKTLIPPRSQIAVFLNQPPFNGPNTFRGSFSFTAAVPVSVVALRGLNNERNEFLITTLPVSDLTATTGEVLVFTHFAYGGGWTTEVILVNPTDSVMRGAVQFLGQGKAGVPGQPVDVIINGQLGSSFPYSIAPRSSVALQTTGTAEAILAGSVRILPEAGQRNPSGLGVFSFRNNRGITVSEAGVPAARPGAAFRMYVASIGTFGAIGSVQSGVAVANLSSNDVKVDFDATNLDGSPVGFAGSIVIPGSGQIAVFLNRFPGLNQCPRPSKGF